MDTDPEGTASLEATDVLVVRMAAWSSTVGRLSSYTRPVQSAQGKSNYSHTDHDPGTVDPTWAPPSGLPVTRNRRTITTPLLYGSILLALVLVVVAIWGFGGFKRRTDQFITTPPGTLFTTGPYEFRFIEATAQHKKDFGGTPYWEVVAIGEGRTTGTESIYPATNGERTMFASKDDLTQEIAVPDSVRLGRGDGFKFRFTPGLPLNPYAVVFKYKDSYRPGATIRFAVFDLVYGKHFIASEEEGWHNGTYARQFYLPVRVLPEQMY